MTYVPKKTASNELLKALTLLNTAKGRWDTYAMALGNIYSDAYDQHKEAVNEVGENLRVKSELMYWLLALGCVSLAGGVAGGLMAPWVAGAGANTGMTILRNAASGIAGSGTQAIVQKTLDATRKAVSPQKPAGKTPDKYKGEMLEEIGRCFMVLADNIEEEMQRIDKDPQGNSFNSQAFISKLAEDPLLYWAPDQYHLPDKNIIGRELEIGMWIAWAHARDIEYWKKRWAGIKNMNWEMGPALRLVEELKRLEPVTKRLRALDIYDATTSSLLSYGMRPEYAVSNRDFYEARYPDFNKLRVYGNTAKGLYLGWAALVIKDPYKVLGDLADTSPLWSKKR